MAQKQKISVLFPSPLECFDYESTEALSPGTFVRAPFGKLVKTGVVWHKESATPFSGRCLKEIEEVLPVSTLKEEELKFIDWVARYNCVPAGSILKMFFGNEDLLKISKSPLVFQTPNPDFNPVCFSQAQKKIVNALSEKIQDKFYVALLQGVTGSGKTEVYFELIAKIIREEKQALVLVPEINLTSQWRERFEKRFGTAPAYWHSGMTAKQKRDTWQAVRSKKAKVVIGARSALFLPFHDLGLIIVDEEHDSSYKQEEGILYQARDMAVVRAKIENIPLLLSTATPSLETYAQVTEGKYDLFLLPERYAHAQMPEIDFIDMRKEHPLKSSQNKWISEPLAEAVRQTLAQKEQALLFLNRRGYAPLVLCKACGEKIQCPHCSCALVEHRRENILQCHYCGYTIKRPDICPSCGEKDSLISCGPGVERVAEEARLLFPDAQIETITSDTVTTLKEFSEIVDKLNQGKIDILVGTQMLAKGHHFPNLTLVGIIDADLGLAGGDLRAGERSFQLLSQVIGRAGREQKKGRAFLQTFSPDAPVLKAMKNGNISEFLQEEMKMRRFLHMPPFGRLASVILSGKKRENVEQAAQKLARCIPDFEGLEVLGPAQAPLFLLKKNYRYRFLVKTEKGFNTQAFLKKWIQMASLPASVHVKIDIDPYNFL